MTASLLSKPRLNGAAKAEEPLRPAVTLGMGVKVRLMRVEPRAAEQWLTKNRDNNRPVSRHKVRQYAADMRAGRWRLSNDAVSFDVSGSLVNGQHRLHACVAADAPFLTLVVWNLPDESMTALDSGRKRNTNDSLAIAGREYVKGAGSTVRRIFLGMRHTGGGNSNITRPYSDQEIDEFLGVHHKHVEFAHELLAKGRFKSAPLRAVVSRASIAFKPEAQLRRFCEVLTTGIMREGEDAAVILRNYVLDDTELGSSTGRKELYGKAETALAAFLEGKTCKPLRVAKQELFPIPNEGYWDLAE